MKSRLGNFTVFVKHLKGNWRVMVKMVVLCFLKYSPPDSSVLLLSESDREAYPGFVFLHKWFIVSKKNKCWHLTGRLWRIKWLYFALRFDFIIVFFVDVKHVYREGIETLNHIVGFVTTEVWTANIPLKKEKKKHHTNIMPYLIGRIK